MRVFHQGPKAKTSLRGRIYDCNLSFMYMMISSCKLGRTIYAVKTDPGFASKIDPPRLPDYGVVFGFLLFVFSSLFVVEFFSR